MGKRLSLEEPREKVAYNLPCRGRNVSMDHNKGMVQGLGKILAVEGCVVI